MNNIRSISFLLIIIISFCTFPLVTMEDDEPSYDLYKNVDKLAIQAPQKPIKLPATVVHTSKPKEHFQWGAASNRGKRKTMEDFYSITVEDELGFFGLFDGHRGPRAAKILQKNLWPSIKKYFYNLNYNFSVYAAIADGHRDMEEMLLTIAESLPKEMACNDGSCAISALMEDNVMYVANVGDSRAILSAQGTAMQITTDHKPQDPAEYERIKEKMGYVIPDVRTAFINTQGQEEFKTWRVIPRESKFGLDIARTFGDADIKAQDIGIIATPEICSFDILPEHEFVILASDGVWNVLSNQEAVDLVLNELNQTGNSGEAARALCDAALEKDSADNVSAIVIVLDNRLVMRKKNVERL